MEGGLGRMEMLHGSRNRSNDVSRLNKGIFQWTGVQANWKSEFTLVLGEEPRMVKVDF